MGCAVSQKYDSNLAQTQRECFAVNYILKYWSTKTFSIDNYKRAKLPNYNYFSRRNSSYIFESITVA